MGCATGTCGVSFGQRVLDAQAQNDHEDLGGHCCSGCKADAERAARVGRAPMLRIVNRVPVSMMGGASQPAGRPVATPAPSAAPMAPAPMLQTARHGYPDAGRRFPRIDPASFVYVMGASASAWCQLDAAAKLLNVRQFEQENPGAIGDEMAFIRGMDAHCTSTMILGQPGTYRTAYVGGSFGLAASGDPSWSGSGAYYTYGTDSSGVTWDFDANGNPIAGSGATADGTSVPDSSYTGTGLVYGQEILGPTGGTGTPASVAAADSPAQLAATRALWGTVGSLITSAGTDIAALINSGNQLALARINADLALALHSGVSPTTGQSLTPAEIAQMQQLQGLLAPKSAPLSTTAKVGIGAGILGVAAYLLGYL